MADPPETDEPEPDEPITGLVPAPEVDVSEADPEPSPDPDPEPACRPVPGTERHADDEPEAEPEPEPEVDAEPEPEVEDVDEVAPALARLEDGVQEVRQGLAELVRLTRRADDHVTELHAENQRLRAGELASVTLPLVRDVVRLHDEVAQLATAASPEAAEDLALVRSRLIDTLARWGLTPFAPEPGDALDATRHNGVGTVPSSDGVPGTIASVRRVGFAHDDGRPFRPADVEVFRAPPPPTPTDPSTED